MPFGDRPCRRRPAHPGRLGCGPRTCLKWKEFAPFQPAQERGDHAHDGVALQPAGLAQPDVLNRATAVATRFSVITQEISSRVADKVPRTCGSTRLASVMVMPNSMLDSWTISRMSHWRPLMLNRPPCAVVAFNCGFFRSPGGVECSLLLNNQASMPGKQAHTRCRSMPP